MDDLRSWLAAQPRGAKTRLARAADIAYSTLLAIEAGRARPLAATARRIEAATGGEVRAARILGLEPTQSGNDE